MNRFVLRVDPFQNAKFATRIGAVIVIHHVLGAEIVGMGTVSTALRRKAIIHIILSKVSSLD